MDGDACQSVAIAHNVSTFYLAYNNNLDIYCSDLTMGTMVCIPQRCDIYTVQPNDTRTSIIRTVSGEITVIQLQTGILISISSVETWTVWTAQLYASGKIHQIVQTNKKLTDESTLTGGWLNNSNSASPSTATIAAPVPTNVAQGTDSDSGNTILSKMGISVHLFLFRWAFPSTTSTFSTRKLTPTARISC